MRTLQAAAVLLSPGPSRISRGCRPRASLLTGSGPYSTARWNPFGRFLVLCGIGNLPGDLAFYDKKADGKCKSMGQSRCVEGGAGGGAAGQAACDRSAVTACLGGCLSVSPPNLTLSACALQRRERGDGRVVA